MRPCSWSFPYTPHPNTGQTKLDPLVWFCTREEKKSANINSMFWCCNQFEINMFISLVLLSSVGLAQSRFKFLHRVSINISKPCLLQHLYRTHEGVGGWLDDAAQQHHLLIAVHHASPYCRLSHMPMAVKGARWLYLVI